MSTVVETHIKWTERHSCMTDLKAVGTELRDYLRLHSVRIVGLTLAGASLVSLVAAEPDDFSFINDTLSGLTTAILNVLPQIGEIVSVGAPLVVKVAIYSAIASPFVWVALKLTKHL